MSDPTTDTPTAADPAASAAPSTNAQADAQASASVPSSDAQASKETVSTGTEPGTVLVPDQGIQERVAKRHGEIMATRRTELTGDLAKAEADHPDAFADVHAYITELETLAVKEGRAIGHELQSARMLIEDGFAAISRYLAGA